MLRNLPRFQLTLLAFIAAGALMAGCGDDGDSGKKGANLTCAEGTKLVGSECVLDTEPTTCAEGTKLEGTTCVPLVSCGEGTIADATGACVPEDAKVECGDGTVLDGESCVPDTTELCQPGTHVEGDRCVPDVVCGPGTTAKDGECLTNGDILAGDADVTEADEQNDPAQGGTAQAIDLPAASESLTVAGTIGAPADLNGDGFLDQDFDAYAIEGTAGDYLRIETLNNGASSTSFKVEGPQGYLRFAPSYTDHGERQVFLPYDGTYTITVGPSAHLLDTTLGAQGGEDAGYILVVENLGDFDLSGATELDAAVEGATVEGNFSTLSDNLAAITAPGNSLVRLTLAETGADAGTPTAILLTAAGEVLDAQPLTGTGVVTFPLDDNDLRVLVDYEQLKGTRDAYALSAAIKTATPAFPDPLAPDTSARPADQAHTVAPGDSFFMTFDVELVDANGDPTPQGQIVRVLANDLGAAGNANFVRRVWDPKGNLVDGFKGLYGFHATLEGTYTIEFGNVGTTDPLNITIIEFNTHVPMELGTEAFDATTNTSGSYTFPVLLTDEFHFVTFESAEALSATLAASQVTSSTLVVGLMRADTTMLSSVSGSAPDLPDYPLMEPGRYFALIYNYSYSEATSVNVSLNTAPAPTQASEPNDTIDTATPISALQENVLDSLVGAPGRDKDVFKLDVDLTEPTFALVGVSPLAGDSDIVAELKDENGVLYDTYTAQDGVIVSAVLQPGTDYYVHVSRTSGSDEVPYLVTYIHVPDVDAKLDTEPNDTDDLATEMSPPSPPDSLAYRAGGTLHTNGDIDWYTLEIPSDSLVDFALVSLGLDQPAATITVELFEDDGTGLTSAGDAKGLRSLAAGTKYLKVSGADPAGSNNSYRLEATLVSSYELGTAPADDLTKDNGTFDDTGMKIFTLEVADDLAADDALVIWSDAVLSVFDPAGAPVHTATTIGAGFSATGLSAGTYLIKLSGAANADWQIFFGILDHTLEDEQVSGTSNDDHTAAEDMGTLAVGTALHRFGAAGLIDDDWYSFEVPDLNGDGSDIAVLVEEFVLAETVSFYEEYYLYDDPTGWSSLKNMYNTSTGTYKPLFWTEEVAPGTYYVKIDQWSRGFDSGDYLLRISVAPPAPPTP